MFLDQCVESSRLGPLHLIHLLAPFENYESGHGRDSEVSRNVLGGIDITLEEGHARLVGRGELERDL